MPHMPAVGDVGPGERAAPPQRRLHPDYQADLRARVAGGAQVEREVGNPDANADKDGEVGEDDSAAFGHRGWRRQPVNRELKTQDPKRFEASLVAASLSSSDNRAVMGSGTEKRSRRGGAPLPRRGLWGLGWCCFGRRLR